MNRASLYDEDGIDGQWNRAMARAMRDDARKRRGKPMNLNDDAPPLVVCPVCDRTVTRTVLADPPVHRACGRELESVWTWCTRCNAYRHHPQFTTRRGDISVCDHCGQTKRFSEDL